MEVQKRWIVRYRPRGNNYSLMTPYTEVTIARTKKEAKENVLFRIGDMYRIVEVKVKD